MRCFVLLSVFLLFSGVFCDDSKSSSDIENSDERAKDDGCWYIIDENAFDLSSAKGRVLSYTQPTSDGKNITWNWSLCGPMNGTVCDPSSAMCVVDENGKVINYGNASTVQTVTGDNDALTLKFTDGDECAPGQKREAVVYLLCSKKKKVEFVVKDVQQTDCSASLTIASRWGCAVDFDEDDDDENLAPLLISIFGSVFCLAVCASVILCCARRRWLKKRAFQRLHEEMQTQVPAPVQVAPQPMFHPQPLQQPIRLVVPVQQGQQMYYPMSMYPPVQMPTAPVPTQVAVPREAQVHSDEQMAQQLQAQFDKEAQ